MVLNSILEFSQYTASFSASIKIFVRYDQYWYMNKTPWYITDATKSIAIAKCAC